MKLVTPSTPQLSPTRLARQPLGAAGIRKSADLRHFGSPSKFDGRIGA